MKNGTVCYTCTLCGETFNEEISTGHSYENGVCIHCGAEEQAGSAGSDDNSFKMSPVLIPALVICVVGLICFLLMKRNKKQIDKAQEEK